MEFNATFLVSVISFLVFTFIMNKIFYAPLEKVINERENMINGNYKEAADTKKSADAIRLEREQRLDETNKKSKKIISEKVNDANEHSKTMTVDAKNLSNEQITSAKNGLKSEAQKTSEELKAKVKDLAEVISSKVLGTDTKITNNDNELINRILN